MESKLNEIKSIFSNSELNTGKLIITTNVENKSSHSQSDPNIFYRCCQHQSSLYFLLYDFKSLFFCQQSYNEVKELNEQLNPSLEFSDINNLIHFLLENFIKVESNLQITKTDNLICFEVLVNIIKVRWNCKCQILDLDIMTNYITLQDLFVKPILNLLFSFQNFLTNEKKNGLNSASSLNKSEVNIGDVELLLGNMHVNKQKNFDKNLLKLTVESTRKINQVEKNMNGRSRIEKSSDCDRNLSEDHDSFEGKQNEKKKKNLKRKKQDESSHNRDKSSEKTISDDDRTLLVHKMHIDKKKKTKLKFV